MHDDFRRAIEEIKLRAPIEDVVRERVPELRRRGALWEARCPFHEERTPSFKVTPDRGTWHCFGSCAEGGDSIRFVERFEGLSFLEAVELLARATGVELPSRGRGREGEGRGPELLDLCARAARFYARTLHEPEGRGALEYLTGRGLSLETLEAFQLGYAPAGGRALVDLARGQGVEIAALERAGLARTADRGHAYDFFRGRLIIPIRDLHGRVVGFGARRIDAGGEPAARNPGPKYVNTPETEVFKKSRLIYGLDRALPEVRRSHHLVLFEGYTDVMAAHQVGLTQVGAVLGTATTEDHAALVRRSSARRVTLIFDGDEAGRGAAYKALLGLLPLELELDVVSLGGGADPCDVLLAEGAQAFAARLAGAQPWLEFIAAGLTGSTGLELSREVDRALDLLALLPTPVLREEGLRRLATVLGLAPEVLREQAASRPSARRSARSGPERPGTRAQGPARAFPGVGHEQPASPATDRSRPADLRATRAYAGIAGALLLDSSLVPLARPSIHGCSDPELLRVLEVILHLYEDEEREIDAQAVLDELGDDPARKRVVGLAEHASRAESPRVLLESALGFLRTRGLEEERRAVEARIAELEVLEKNEAARGAPVAPEITRELGELLMRVRAWGESAPPGSAGTVLTSTGPSR